MTDFLRQARHCYEDPLSRVWIACAERLGFRVERTENAYASTDGRGTILIAVEKLFDPDDSVAQMIFHELCHALVEGEEGEGREDWGLGYHSGGNPWREHACLRLQAYLADGVGLREFFAPTTDFRVSFWDSLPKDPFWTPAKAGGRRERSCVAGRKAAWRASLPRWEPLRQALAASAVIAAATPRRLASESRASDGLAGGRLPSLWSEAGAPPLTHPSGHSSLAAYFPGQGCADCAWGFVHRNARYCRHAPNRRLPEAARACRRFEPAVELDCLACGACCREAYDSVEVSADEAVNKRHPEMVVILDAHRKLRRDGDRCQALGGGQNPTEPYACAIYPDRPQTCRDFSLGSENCLDARRRVGLSL